MHLELSPTPSRTQLDVAALEDIGFDRSRGLIVVNYFNKQIGDLHKASRMNEYCEGYFEKFTEVYFLMLHYRDDINKDEMCFADLQSFYSDLPDKERWAFHAKIQQLEEAEPGTKAGARSVAA